jgi:PcfJ-like protein
MWKASERAMAKKQAPLTVAPRWWKPARCAKILLSGADLIAEGHQMHHCAATYAGYVANGNSVVIALRVPQYHYARRTPYAARLKAGAPGTASVYRVDSLAFHRSTAELDRKTLAVRQHKGPGNVVPHMLCQRALAVLLRRWRDSVASCPVDWGCVDQFKSDEDLPF